jgi:ABC-type glycerol-3-phosphate transport system substrate-binding protein
MMKRLKKILSLITAAALCVGLLAGCGSSGTLTETNRLNIYNIAGNDSRKLAFCYSVNSRFQANYPDVGLDYRTSEYQYYVFTFGSGITDKVKDELQQYYDSVSVNIMKGKGEDVIFADTFYQWFDDVTPPDWQKMVRAGAFADLIPLVSNYAPDIDLSVFDDLLIDGKLYAIPVAREPFYIFSAEKMLEKWGFDFDASDDTLTFLRKCAQWQQEHETDPSAPVVF